MEFIIEKRKSGLVEVMERGHCIEKFTVIKYKNMERALAKKPYDILESVCESGINCLLNAGITLLLNLLIKVDTTHYFDAPVVGVGSTATAADPTQTNLLDGSADWHAMEATFPSVSAQTVTFQAQFGDGHAEFHWQECAAKQASGATTVFNRVVSDKGTKAAGEVWSAKLQITFA